MTTDKKYTPEELSKREDQTDWKKVDALKDADIEKAVANDPDAKLLSKDDFKKMRPARKRGPQKAPTKKATTIRLDGEVLDYFKAQGKGWQTRINQALHEYMEAQRVAKGADALGETGITAGEVVHDLKKHQQKVV